MEVLPEPLEKNDLLCYENLSFVDFAEREYAFLCFDLRYCNCKAQIDRRLNMTVVSVTEDCYEILTLLGNWIKEKGIRVHVTPIDLQRLFSKNQKVWSLLINCKLDDYPSLWSCIRDQDIPQPMFLRYYEAYCSQ